MPMVCAWTPSLASRARRHGVWHESQRPGSRLRGCGTEEMRWLLLLAAAVASQSQPTSAPDAAGGCGDGSDCMHGGVCADGSCVCVDGFSGRFCESSPDRCHWPAPVHCVGSARCVNGECVRPEPCSDVWCGAHGSCVGGACVCELGWAGADCLDVDECASGPCYNGGACFHSGDVAESDMSSLGASWTGQFVCSCAAGFSGDRCQCPDCGDHGACQPETGMCLCKAGYAGLSCEYDINDCHSAPCEHGSTCVDGVDRYECVCMPGFGGPSCNENIDDCASAPCRNGGTCEDLVEAYVCSCTDTFAGTECEISMDACYSTPCANGAECALTASSDSFVCHCADGFEGSRCERNIDDCASQPCSNGARCVDTTSGFSCVCIGGWSGPLCAVHVCEQTSYALCGEGDCTRDTSAVGYSCTCRNGWRGQHCDQKPDPCTWPVVVQCGAHGRCQNGGCSCSDGYAGAHCEVAPNRCLWPIPIDCGAHGLCEDGACECEPGWTGDRCTRPPFRRPLWETSTPPPPPGDAVPLTPHQLALLERRHLELHGPEGARSSGGLSPEQHAEAASFEQFRKLHWGTHLRPVRREF